MRWLRAAQTETTGQKDGAVDGRYDRQRFATVELCPHDLTATAKKEERTDEGDIGLG
jgi:hypothetical protein